MTELADILDKNVRKLDERNNVSSDLSICESKGLLQDRLYVFVPWKDAGKIVKKQISEYAKKNNINFVVTVKEFCDDRECNGHYIDPFEAGFASKKVHVNKFPEDINGGYIHILKPSVKIMANQLLYTF